jgi:hypothetical protein
MKHIKPTVKRATKSYNRPSMRPVPGNFTNPSPDPPPESQNRIGPQMKTEEVMLQLERHRRLRAVQVTTTG